MRHFHSRLPRENLCVDPTASKLGRWSFAKEVVRHQTDDISVMKQLLEQDWEYVVTFKDQALFRKTHGQMPIEDQERNTQS
jgi:hypothetical protein